MAISENTRNNLSIGLSHKVNTVSAQETEQKNMSEETAFTLGIAMLLLMVIVLLYVLV
jgi:flagellar biogenesis protein FliO